MITTNIGLAKSVMGALAISLLAGPAMAQGHQHGPAPQGQFAWTGSFAVTSDYVFRGMSQTAERPAVQAMLDLTYGIFYSGVFLSNLDFGENGAGRDIAPAELTFMSGIKPVVGPITFDFGVIYYTYPRALDPGMEINFFEVKAGASMSPWKGGMVGVTGFYSPEYTFETGAVFTLEGSVAHELPKFGTITPTFSALIGAQWGDDATYTAAFGGADSYVYWNAGVTLAFHERFSLDLRYWDSDLDFCTVGKVFACDERFVATAKVTF